MTFNPKFVNANVSLNRLVIQDLPETDFPRELKGSTGYNLVSSHALQTLLEKRFRSPEITPSDLQAAFWRSVANEELQALEIATVLGKRLGYLLLCLLRGDAVNRTDSFYSPAYWDYWGTVQKIYFGGGLLTGVMGRVMLAEAQACLNPHVSAVSLHLAEHPAYLASLGAARSVIEGEQACIFDFGSSYVKRSIAHYQDDSLSALQVLDAEPFGIHMGAAAEQASAIFERMVAIIAETLTAYPVDSPIVPVSISGYVDEHGQPEIAPRGLYMHIARLSPNAQNHLSEVLTERLGRKIQIRLWHDGTAAALFFAPQDYAAVISIGTAMGIGFPVPRENLRPVAEAISLTSAFDERGG